MCVKEEEKIVIKMNRCTSLNHTKSMIVLCCVLLGLPAITLARSGLQSEESAPPFKVQKCRINCLEKVCGNFHYLKYVIFLSFHDQ